MTHDDPAIAAIREARHHISAAYKHDPKSLIAYYQQLQETYSDRILSTAGPMNRRFETITYSIPAMAEHALAENKAEDFDVTQESTEID